MTALTLLAATVAMLVAAVRYKHGVLLAIGVGVATHYTYRSIVLGHALDEPYPAYLFPSRYQDMFQQIDLLLILWVLVLLGTTAALRRSSDSFGSFTVPPKHIQPRLWPIIAIVTSSTMLLIASKDGVAATQRFVRLGDNGEGGTGVFLVAPAVLLVASIIRFRASPPRSRDQMISVVAMALAVSIFFIVGSRTPIIAVIASFVLAALLRMMVRKTISMRVVAAVSIIAILLPVLAVSLRTQRDVTLTEGYSVEQDTSFSEAINATYYDVLALAVRDSGERYADLGPGVFLNQSLGIVPRAIWESKPEFVSVGKWLRRQYEPSVINGWPPGPPGDWYLAVGLVGVIVGAALSGLFANFLDRFGQRMGSPGGPRANFELSVLWGFVLLPGGIDSEIVSRALIWVILPLLYVRVFSVGASTRSLGVSNRGGEKARIHHRNG